MCTIFKAAVRTALPQARLVVNHFHMVQLAKAAATEARGHITVQVRAGGGARATPSGTA